MSADDRLQRLLYVLPRAAREDGARIDDLARALDVPPALILADLEEAMTREFYLPAGTVDSFNLSVLDDVVRLYGSEFNRPVRLSAPEAMALGLGLRVLAAEAEVDRRAEILAMAHRLESELIVPEIELQPMSRGTAEAIAMMEPREPYGAPLEVALGEDDFRGAICDAITDRVFVHIVYLKANAPEPAERRVAPTRLLYSHGHWYVAAVDEQSGQPRNYRLDRILSVIPSHVHHDFDAGAASAFVANGGEPVTVRYSPVVAKWVAEREDAQCEADGSLVLTHEVVDMNWLVRHVLQYAGEAVVETKAIRERILDAVRFSA